ncbi:MAG: hypothetical protein ABSD70_14785 [Terracidiphilus sp.]|jgi:uncharacterized membrane protein
MSIEVWGMMGAGAAALVAGMILVRPRFLAATGADKILVLGPALEAVPLAIFAAEHFTDAHGLMQIVPKWLPGPLFWTYLVGAALLAAALSFMAFRCVRWSAALLALLFLIIVATVDLPGLPANLHDRIFWTLTVRELCFASGAMVLAGSVWPSGSWAGGALVAIGRRIVATVMVFYGIEHFFFPHNVPGVPLEKLTPVWMPAPLVIAYFVGIILVIAGVALFFRRTVRIAAAACGAVLLLLTAFFYGAIMVAQIHADAVEGINYFGDTLLFASTVLLAGSGAAERKKP